MIEYLKFPLSNQQSILNARNSSQNGWYETLNVRCYVLSSLKYTLKTGGKI